MKLIDTDIIGGPFPDEKFIEPMPNLTTVDAIVIASLINSYAGPSCSRCCRAVTNDYKLLPGLEP